MNEPNDTRDLGVLKLPWPILSLLNQNGIRTVTQLKEKDAEDLKAIDGLGMSSIVTIQDALRSLDKKKSRARGHNG